MPFNQVDEVLPAWLSALVTFFLAIYFFIPCIATKGVQQVLQEVLQAGDFDEVLNWTLELSYMGTNQ